MDTLKDVLRDSIIEFNPVLRELCDSFKITLRDLKVLSTFDKEVKLEDIVLKPNETSEDAYLTPIKNCELALLASVDGERKEYNLKKNHFSESSNLLDLIIGMNALGKIDSFQEDSQTSILSFATLGKVRIPTMTNTEVVEANTIVYLEADGNFTQIFDVKGKKIRAHKPMSFFHENYPEELFFRIHGSYMVNVDFIAFWDKDAKKVTLKEKPEGCDTDFKTELDISRDYKQLFLYFAKKYL